MTTYRNDGSKTSRRIGRSSGRSVVTGRYVTTSVARRSPRTTATERPASGQPAAEGRPTLEERESRVKAAAAEARIAADDRRGIRTPDWIRKLAGR